MAGASALTLLLWSLLVLGVPLQSTADWQLRHVNLTEPAAHERGSALSSASAEPAPGYILLQQHQLRRHRHLSREHHGHHALLSHEARQERVAVLISGQLVRFTYQDGLKTSLQELLCGEEHCPFAVDVFVVLSKTKTRPWVGFLPKDSPPYGEHAFSPESIVSFYKSKGATNVEVFLWSDREMLAKLLHVEARAAQVGSSTEGMPTMKWVNALSHLRKSRKRWQSNGAMLLLRHKAYKAALKVEEGQPWQYKNFLYIREDNAFVRGFHKQGLMLAMDNNDADVLVDQYCGFGSYSDKIYFVNRKGGDMLFAPTYHEFVERMALWVNRGLDGDAKEDDPLQTEGYLEFLLDSSGERVAKVDFGRVDLRYEGRRACTPGLYFRCTAHPGRVFPNCDPEDDLALSDDPMPLDDLYGE